MKNLGLLVVLFSGCQQQCADEQQKYTGQLNYTKDYRTGVCYAGLPGASFPFTAVPCSLAVENLIPGAGSTPAR